MLIAEVYRTTCLKTIIGSELLRLKRTKDKNMNKQIVTNTDTKSNISLPTVQLSSCINSGNSFLAPAITNTTENELNKPKAKPKRRRLPIANTLSPKGENILITQKVTSPGMTTLL